MQDLLHIDMESYGLENHELIDAGCIKYYLRNIDAEEAYLMLREIITVMEFQILDDGAFNIQSAQIDWNSVQRFVETAAEASRVALKESMVADGQRAFSGINGQMYCGMNRILRAGESVHSKGFFQFLCDCCCVVISERGEV